MSLIPKEIEEHYLQSKESERLSGERGELERLRTQAILARNLPPAPADPQFPRPSDFGVMRMSTPRVANARSVPRERGPAKSFPTARDRR